MGCKVLLMRTAPPKRKDRDYDYEEGHRYFDRIVRVNTERRAGESSGAYASLLQQIGQPGEDEANRHA